MIHFVRSYWVEYNAYAGWWDELKRGWRERESGGGSERGMGRKGEGDAIRCYTQVA